MGNYESSFTGTQIDDFLLKSPKNIDGSGTDTITGSFTGLTYTEGICVILTTAGTNSTNLVTLNINSLGAKSVYKLHKNSTKLSLEVGDMPKVAFLYYDGTDFILINAEKSLEDYELENSINNSKKTSNLLPDVVALCEDGSLFTNSNTSDSDDTSNRKFGKSAVKITNSASNGLTSYNILSLLDTSKYYLVVAEMKNGDLSGSGIKLRVNNVGDVALDPNSYITATTYTRQGVIMQPSDFDVASASNIIIETDGSSSEFSYLDNLSLRVITASEYAEGVTALLTKYPFTSSKGTTSYDEIITLGDSDSVTEGRLDVTQYGLSTVNLLDDDVAGCESTSGWLAGNATVSTDNSNKLEGASCLKITTSGDTTGSIYRDILSSLDTSKYYLFSAYVLNETGTIGIRLSVNCVSDAGLVNATYSTNTFYKRQGVVIKPSDFDSASSVQVRIYVSGAIGEIGYVDAIMLQEITAEEYNQGADALLAKYNYHRGLEGAKGRVKSVGKNLFDKNKITINYQVDNTDGTNTASTGENASDYIKVNSDNNYYISGCSNTSNTDGAYYNQSKEYISGFTSYGALTIPSTAKYVRFTVDDDDLDTAQLEINTSATTYEEYTETIAYTPETLHSVPATSDEYNYNTGKLTKNVVEYTLQSADIDSLTSYTNVDIVGINVQSDALVHDRWKQVAVQYGSESIIRSLTVLNSEIYGGTHPSGKLYKWNGSNAWTEVAGQLGSETNIYSLVTLNGEIYGGTIPNGKLYKWDGSSAWTEVAGQYGSETRIYSLTVLNSEIYAGTYPNGKLYKWDGSSTWTEVAGQLGSESIIRPLTVLNGEIYAGTYPNGKLYKWNGSNAWTEVAGQLGSETIIYSLTTLNGEIYGGASPNGKLYKWNGVDAWTEVAPQYGSETYVWALTTLNGEIYGGTSPNGKLLKWNGSSAWTEVAGQYGSETHIYSLTTLNSKIYGGTYPNANLLEVSTLKNNILIDGYPCKEFEDDTDNENTFISSPQSFGVVVPSGTYADLASAQSGLAGTEIVYQLATPEITYYPSQTLHGRPNGTIYSDLVTHEYLTYSDALYLQKGLEISTVVAVNKITVDTNNNEVYESIDVSESSIDYTDEVSLTNGSAGERYEIIYSYIGGTKGYIDYLPCVNVKDQLNGNTEDIKDLEVKIKKLDASLTSEIKTVNLTLGAISATTSFISFIALVDCEIIDLNIVTKDAISANDTNYWSITLVNKGSDGTGTDNIISKDTTATSGEGFSAYTIWNGGAVNSDYSNLNSGDVALLTFTKTASATAFAESFASIKYRVR